VTAEPAFARWYKQESLPLPGIEPRWSVNNVLGKLTVNKLCKFVRSIQSRDSLTLNKPRPWVCRGPRHTDCKICVRGSQQTHSSTRPWRVKIRID
jgi:hypothetical protein